MMVTTNRSRPILVMITFICFMTLATTALSASTVTFYTTSASFNAAEPGLPVEGFNNANVAPASLSLLSSPLSSATKSSLFQAGSILPGLTISNLNSLNTPGLIVYGSGALSGSSNSVGTDWFGDTLVLNFNPGVSAMGADVFAATSPGLTLAGMFTAEVFSGSTLLGSTSFSEAQGGFGYLGVSSTTSITSVDLLYVTDDATTFADNIAFGPAIPTSNPPGPPTIFPPPPVTNPSGPPTLSDTSGTSTPSGPIAATPEPSTLTLLCVGLSSIGLLQKRVRAM